MPGCLQVPGEQAEPCPGAAASGTSRALVQNKRRLKGREGLGHRELNPPVFSFQSHLCISLWLLQAVFPIVERTGSVGTDASRAAVRSPWQREAGTDPGLRASQEPALCSEALTAPKTTKQVWSDLYNAPAQPKGLQQRYVFEKIQAACGYFYKGARAMLRILRKCFSSYASVQAGLAPRAKGLLLHATLKKNMPLYRSEQRREGC